MGVVKVSVCRTVRLRECPLGELLLYCFLQSQHRQEIKRANQNPKPMDTAAPRAGNTPRRAKKVLFWAWFCQWSAGKIPDDRGFYCFPTVPDIVDKTTGDRQEESGAFLFFRRVPDFSDSRRSFSTYHQGNSNFYCPGCRRWKDYRFCSVPILHLSPHKSKWRHGRTVWSSWDISTIWIWHDWETSKSSIVCDFCNKWRFLYL